MPNAACVLQARRRYALSAYGVTPFAREALTQPLPYLDKKSLSFALNSMYGDLPVSKQDLPKRL